MPADEPNRRTIYRGRKINLALLRVPQDDGTTVEREVVVHRGAVVLLVEVDADRLCLVRVRRHAVGATLLEVPAGTIDAGETPEETARRELREETGYTAARLEHVRSWWVSPGVFSERMHLFRASGLTPGPLALDAGEELEPVVVGWDEALAMADDGRIEDGKTLVALWVGARLRGRAPAR